MTLGNFKLHIWNAASRKEKSCNLRYSPNSWSSFHKML